MCWRVKGRGICSRCRLYVRVCVSCVDVDLPLQPFHMAICGRKSSLREHSWVRGVSNIMWTWRQTFLGSGSSRMAVEREC